MAVAIVICTLIAAVAYLIPRLAMLKVNMDQLAKLEAAQAAMANFDLPDVEGDDVKRNPYL